MILPDSVSHHRQKIVRLGSQTYSIFASLLTPVPSHLQVSTNKPCIAALLFLLLFVIHTLPICVSFSLPSPSCSRYYALLGFPFSVLLPIAFPSPLFSYCPTSSPSILPSLAPCQVCLCPSLYHNCISYPALLTKLI